MELNEYFKNQRIKNSFVKEEPRTVFESANAPVGPAKPGMQWHKTSKGWDQIRVGADQKDKNAEQPQEQEQPQFKEQ